MRNCPPAAPVAATTFRVLFYFSLPQRKMVSPAVVVAAATRSASGSILRCREEERFRLQSATNPRLHRFLISGLDLGIDARFSLFKPSCVHRLLISGPDLRIDARFSPETAQRLHRFLISGPDFRINARKPSRTAQRLHRFLISGPDLRIDAGFSTETPSSVHRFLISGSDLRIDVSFSPETASCVYRFLISRPDLGITAAPSLLQLKTARLQHSRGVQAGTGCHEGGIILSKQPPEWRLSLPQQRSASDSNFRCCS